MFQKIILIILPFIFLSNVYGEDLKVGFISILTGQYSDVGQSMANSAQLAIEDYEKESGAKVKFFLEDDGADPRKGLSAFLKLIELDKVDLIFPISTFTIGSARDRVNQLNRVAFILGNEPYEPVDDSIYMVTPAAIPAERSLGKFVGEKHASGEVLVIASQNEAILRFAKAVKEGVGERASLIEVPAELMDFRGLALSIKRKNPTALIFNSFPLDSARLLKELFALQVKVPIYFDDSIANSLSDVKNILGDLSKLREAMILTYNTENSPLFTTRYQERFGESPRYWSDYSYDAVKLGLKLRDKDLSEAKAWLSNNVYEGVSGKITFDQVGLRLPDYSIIPIMQHPNFKQHAK